MSEFLKPMDLANVVNHAIDPGGDTLEQLQAKVGMKPN